jgi:acetyl-CoA acetyltransferase
MTDAFVLGGVRTPVGKYGGALSHVRPDDLLGRTMVAACEKVGVPLERIEDIAAGCVKSRTRGWATSRAGRRWRRASRTRSRRRRSTASAPPRSPARRRAARARGRVGDARARPADFGSSGTRYVLTLATELRPRQARYGVLGVCVGSGQGVALVLENVAA